MVLDAVGQGVVGVLGAPVLIGHNFAVLLARTRVEPISFTFNCQLLSVALRAEIGVLWTIIIFLWSFWLIHGSFHLQVIARQLNHCLLEVILDKARIDCDSDPYGFTPLITKLQLVWPYQPLGRGLLDRLIWTLRSVAFQRRFFQPKTHLTHEDVKTNRFGVKQLSFVRPSDNIQAPKRYQ